MNATQAFSQAVAQQLARAADMLEMDVPHFQVTSAVRLMQRRSPIIVTGMGKSGHIGMKAAATFRSLGFPAHFLHPGEASHGDLGMIQDNSVVLAISNSGETKELGDILAHCKERGTAIIAITSKADSTLANMALAAFITGTIEESCPNGLAPTTSTWIAMLICDALAVALACTEGRTAEDFHRYHPGGSLGARLRNVKAVMHPLPHVEPDTPLETVVQRMDRGAVAVVGKHGVQGIITDGDVRRHAFRKAAPGRGAKSIMTADPKTIEETASVSDAIARMNAARVTSLLVADALGAVLGIVHLQDCLTFAR